MCGNTIPCFAPYRSMIVAIEQISFIGWWNSCIPLLNQAGKGRVFYSVNKCFQTGGDPRNVIDKQILKIWTPCLSAFYCVIPRYRVLRRICKQWFSQ